MKKKIFIATAVGLLLTTSGVYAGSRISDISNHQFEEAIINVVDKGYMGYTSTTKQTFSPNQQVTRGQLAQILTNFEEKQAEQYAEQSPVDTTTEHKEDSSELTTIANTMRSVVKITAGNSRGSGVFVNENTILTSFHVVNGQGNITIELSDYVGAVSATIVKNDAWNDLALLRIDNTLKNNNYKVRPISLALADAKLGETVYAFGNPRGLNFTVTKGIISKESQVLEYRDMFQFDAPVHPGNSGGPIVNKKGQLVGIVNSVLTDTQSGEQFDGISFGTRHGFLKDLIKSDQQ